MIFFRRILTIISSVLGASVGLIAMGLFNWSLHLGLSFGNVFLYGVVGGVVFGIVAGYLLTYYFVRRARKFIFGKIGGTLAKFSFLKRV